MSVVRSVTVRTALTPPVTFEVDGSGEAAPSPSTSSAAIVWQRFLAPAVDLDTVLGPVSIAPWGDPGSRWIIAAAVVAVAALAVASLVLRRRS